MGSVATVLVPGLLCSPDLYAPVLPALWQRGPVTVADTLHDTSMRDVAGRLLAGAPERFVLVGLSMGGYVALEVLRQAPERVLGLGLLSTSARPDAPEQAQARCDQLRLVEEQGFDVLVRAAFGALVAAEHEEDEELRARWRAMALAVGPDGFARQQEANLARVDSRPDLGAIACPTLVLHGCGDRLIPAEHGEELAAGIPGARLELLDACGHMATLEQPERAAAALVALLDRVA